MSANALTLRVMTGTSWRRLRRALSDPDTLRGIVGVFVLAVIWELGANSKRWFGFETPWVGRLPALDTVLTTWAQLIVTSSYWIDIGLSFLRVVSGFSVAVVLGIPFGLVIALNRTAYGIAFPPFEVLRPIPPIAWVPAAIIFWPSQSLSIGFVIFYGAFFTIVINVLGGARAIDIRYLQAAQSMGSGDFDIFRRIVLPGVLPSIVVGAVVAMGITWEVVIAAELISGGGSAAGASGGGIGFFIWNAYVTGGASAETQIIVGMFTIGIVGYASCAALRAFGRILTPWLNVR
jgi:NitT/TauT family transport system permease protein